MSFTLDRLVFEKPGTPRYEQLASRIEQAIASGELRPGDRLPTVRQFVRDLKVSATTVTACFELLVERGLVRAEVGRGTFVARPEERPAGAKIENAALAGLPARPFQPLSFPTAPALKPWRRRALMSASSRLRAACADAVECSTGRPDPALLPLSVVRRHPGCYRPRPPVRRSRGDGIARPRSFRRTAERFGPRAHPISSWPPRPSS